MVNKILSKEILPYKNTNLPLNMRIKDLISRLTLKEKLSLLPTRQAAIERLGITEYYVGGEACHGVVSHLGSATVFPQPIGLSSTWDYDLLKSIGSIIGDEARIYYNKSEKHHGLTRWAPTIDMERDPRWGRTEEAYGEDPYLTGKLSSALIKGMQGEDEFYIKLSPAPKHFYGNNSEENRIFSSSSIDPRNKYEYYLKAFEPAFKEGKAYSMMTSYNSINGTPAILNKEIKTIVKDTWGCDGFIVCDGEDMSQTVAFHKYFHTHAETIASALKAGIDCFTDKAELVIEAAKEALERDLISEKDIDTALFNIFKVRFRLGEFDAENKNPYANISETLLCCEKHNEMALKAAKEAVVLLKNNGILPLNKNKLKKLAIIGPLADVVFRDWYTGTHPYKITPLEGLKNKFGTNNIKFCNGNDEVAIKSLSNKLFLCEDDSNLVHAIATTNINNIFELCDWGFNKCTLKSLTTNKYVTTDDKNIYCNADDIWGWNVKELFNISKSDEGVTIKSWQDNNVITNEQDGALKISNEFGDALLNNYSIEITKDGIAEAIEIAKDADAAIIFVGNHPLINGKEEIDRKDICLANRQQQLIKAVHSANPNTIVVLISSYPTALNWENENIPAILYSAHGCQELGNALADVLLGAYNPAGRLSMTWYASTKDLPPINDYDIIKGKRTYMYFDKKPLYPFGYGLSYTSFEYSNLRLNKNILDGNEDLIVNADIKNIGKEAGDEVIQLYIKAASSRVKRPIKALKAFTRIHLQPGEAKCIEFKISPEAFTFWDVTRDKYCIEKGCYELMLGASSEDIKLSASVNVIGEVIPPRNLTKITKAENYDDYENVFLSEFSQGEYCVASRGKGYILFKDVDFKHGLNNFEASISNNFSENPIDIKIDSLDGKLLGSCFAPTSITAYQSQTLSCCFDKISGIHDFYIIFNSPVKISKFILY